MNSFDKKRIDKIYNSINRVALSGMNNLLIYKNLVDEIIQRGEYDYYVQCLLYNYDIDDLVFHNYYIYYFYSLITICLKRIVFMLF